MRTDMPSCSAMRLLDRPREARPATSRSRRVRSGAAPARASAGVLAPSQRAASSSAPVLYPLRSPALTRSSQLDRRVGQRLGGEQQGAQRFEAPSGVDEAIGVVLRRRGDVGDAGGGQRPIDTRRDGCEPGVGGGRVTDAGQVVPGGERQ